MRILVIGGNKFLGRVFIMQSYQRHEIYMLNRGSHHEIEKFGIKDPILDMVQKEYLMDRHDISKLSNIKVNFDVIVDCCAYQKNDIKLLLDSLPEGVNKYIFVSTTDVYQRIGSIAELKGENMPFNHDMGNYPTDLKNYIDGKVLLEGELIEECEKRKMEYCSIRPSIIYGPYNYVPRENLYIQSIVKTGQVVFPEDATGKFQFVYVKDVANAIKRICESSKISHSYNLCSNDILDYQKFAEILLSIVDVPYQDWSMPCDTIIKNGWPLPFPYLETDTELCDGSKIMLDTGFSYTAHLEGIQKTYNAFKKVYQNR